MKVLFCNIAWMKYYRGASEDDCPINGGKYIDMHEDGGEVFNFTHFNRKYYGYVWGGGNIHIERLNGVRRDDDTTNDVLVVWMASDPKQTGVYIVGWYKNATVFRQMQELCVNVEECYNYNIIGKVSDGVLLSEKDRTFSIPLANKNGKGKGKGQSNIWYAEGAEIRRDFLPKVIDYIENWSKPSADKIYTSNELWQHHPLAEGKSTEEMVALEEKQTDKYGILRILNSICAAEPSADNYYNRAVSLWGMGYCDEAFKDLQHALTLNMDDLGVKSQIADYDFVMGHFKKALFGYEAILSGLETDENAASYWQDHSLPEIKLIIQWCLVRTHMALDEKNQAAKYLKTIIKDAPDTKDSVEAKNLLSELGYIQ